MPTKKTTQTITTIPYSPDKTPGTFKRVIAKPIPKEGYETNEGLLIQTDIGRICELAVVIASGPDSTIKPGDHVMYAKMERKDNIHLDTISIDGDVCDVLYENEIYSVNNYPFDLLFVEPHGELEVTEEGLIIPEGTKGVTQKGQVFRAPENYHIKAGSNIEYRKQENGIYPTVQIDGKNYDILREWDIFTVDGNVAPYRIIVKIDIQAQRVKRTTADSGLLRSQLFIFMLYNMQCGEVLEIGVEAQKNYPDLQIGDTAILHHSVEADPYRLIKKVFGKHKTLTYEHRVINAFDKESREIFGRISSRTKKVYLPFGKNKFLEWDFEVMEKGSESSSLFLDFETNIDKCTTLNDLKSVVKHKQDEGFAKAMAKIRGTVQALSKLNPAIDKNKYDRLESELGIAKNEATKVAANLKKNFLLNCKVLGSQTRVLVPYLELYPINILGKKFLIAYEDLILAELVSIPEVERSVAPEAK